MGRAQPFSPDFCRTFSVLPAEARDGGVTVFFSAESDLSVLSYIEYRLQAHVRWQRVDHPELLAMISDQAADESGRKAKTGDASSESEGQREVMMVIDALVRECIGLGASDLHVEPGEKDLAFRMRIDGVLADKRRLPRESAPEVLSRLKIMARLDIAEKRRPQDGRIRFQHEGRTVDIRISVIPTDFGEKAVLRLLDKERLRLDLNSLGMPADQRECFVHHVEAPHGIILVTGPTGSGKTTTLYAALNHLRSPEVNISTVEDPIEYNLAGINQTQVKPEIGLDFAAMLRSLLRQDPDILMIGEIRDRETLEIAIRAAMTGHLVLSTVHTNGACATIGRLIDMGAEPFLLSASVRLIVAQRLLRRVCRSCFRRQWSDVERTAADVIGVAQSERTGTGTGCSLCAGTGFQGRIAVYEMLEISEPLREAVLTRTTESGLLRLAQSGGFTPMKEQAQHLVAAGITAPSEVLREIVV